MSVKELDSGVVWTAGMNGVVLKTVNGGKDWTFSKIPDTGYANFCIDALDSLTAWTAADDMRTGNDFRIYATTDGGKSWKLQLDIPNSFGDAVRFFDRKHGIALGDPSPPDRFMIYYTSDGGNNWNRCADENVPHAQSNLKEFGVTGCLQILGKDAWFATASSNPDFTPRIFHSTDKGKTWKVVSSITGLTGIAVSIDFKDKLNGLAVENRGGRWAMTNDGGKNWSVYNTIDSLWIRDIRFIPGTNKIIIAGGSDFGGYMFSVEKNDFKRIFLPKKIKRIRSVSFVSPNCGWFVGNSGEIYKWKGSASDF
jgi:photosystem II stability/assembly factor-like uncharacterized protein